MKFVLFSTTLLIILGTGIHTSYAESVPDWVKNTAGWWATDAISENEIVKCQSIMGNRIV